MYAISPDLKISCSQGAEVARSNEDTWRLAVPAGAGRKYRLAQLDDFSGVPRRDFPWRPPFALRLRARAAVQTLPGTWGFGLWNDPFSLSLGFGGGVRRFPALPNAAWFFYASPPNYLSVRDDLPAQGFLAATFRSPVLPGLLLGLAAPGLSLLALPPVARVIRRFARRILRQDAVQIDADQRFEMTAWHVYQIDWLPDRTTFRVDGNPILITTISPRGPLALVLWIDNQYAALPPDGRLAYGTLETPEPAWIEIGGLRLDTP
jgi:hypothetical protein